MNPMLQTLAGLLLLLVFMLILGAISKVSEWFEDEKKEKNTKEEEDIDKNRKRKGDDL